MVPIALRDVDSPYKRDADDPRRAMRDADERRLVKEMRDNPPRYKRDADVPAGLRGKK